eukprot:scaffold159734_cov35-Prasinocladus_malaysianus.AAC.1
MICSVTGRLPWPFIIIAYLLYKSVWILQDRTLRLWNPHKGALIKAGLPSYSNPAEIQHFKAVNDIAAFMTEKAPLTCNAFCWTVIS